MLYGAALSAALAAPLVVTFGRCRRTPIVLATAVAAFLMPLAWNLILRDTGATGLFSHDLPFRAFPISWQDTGRAVFTLAGASAVLALGPARGDRPDRVAHWALLAAVAESYWLACTRSPPRHSCRVASYRSIAIAPT